MGDVRLSSLEPTLALISIQCSNCLAVLFSFYIAAEIPSNARMKRRRPSYWLAFIMTLP